MDTGIMANIMVSRYKPAGRRTGVVEGKKDGWEGILVSPVSYHNRKDSGILGVN